MSASNTIFLLDFRHGIVEEIDEAIPPRGTRDPEVRSMPEAIPEQRGVVFAATGSPPEQDAK